MRKGSAFHTCYSPADPSDWDGNIDAVDTALDELATKNNYKLFQGYDGTGSTLFTSSETDVPIDTERQSNDRYSLSANVVTFASDAPTGVYEIRLRTTTGVASGAGANVVRVSIQQDGQEVDGTLAWIDL